MPIAKDGAFTPLAETERPEVIALANRIDSEIIRPRTRRESKEIEVDVTGQHPNTVYQVKQLYKNLRWSVIEAVKPHHRRALILS